MIDLFRVISMKMAREAGYLKLLMNMVSRCPPDMLTQIFSDKS